MNLRSLTAMAAMAAALTIAAQARADVIDFFLNQPEDTTTLIPDSSAVEVTVDLTSSTASTVTFQAPSGGTLPGLNLINVNGSFSASASSLAPGSPCGGNGYAGDAHVCSPGNEDSFGTMSLESGNVSGATTFTFTLTAEGTNSWTDAADVLIPTTGYSTTYYTHGLEAIVAAPSGPPQDAGFYTPAPAPLIGHGLPGILAVAGVLFGAGLIKRGKKHGFLRVRYAG